MSLPLPATLSLLERGWLSANSILGVDGEQATLVDSGYVTHAAQTVDLVRHALAGRQLARLRNTHAHSDHIGGNAALQAAFSCQIIVPAGAQASIAEWDENALLLSPLGQQGARFQHDALMQPGDEFVMGELHWQALAVPGHDMDALAFYNPEKRLLISGDALWENGFGVIFPELLGNPDGLQSTRQTLEALARLPIDGVLPGHGSAFACVDTAFTRAFARLDGFEADIERLAWHAIKVVVSFAMLERRSMPRPAFTEFIASLPFACDINNRYLALPIDSLAEQIEQALRQVKALHLENDILFAG
jgi:glyoxylase-like metal-dependent hydrolase (beta-lactamase superfamily II)